MADRNSSSPILGIDLGTTNSAVGVVDSGFPILLADGEGKRITRSVVHFPEGEDPVVGAAAARAQVTAPGEPATPDHVGLPNT